VDISTNTESVPATEKPKRGRGAPRGPRPSTKYRKRKVMIAFNDDEWDHISKRAIPSPFADAAYCRRVILVAVGYRAK